MVIDSLKLLFIRYCGLRLPETSQLARLQQSGGDGGDTSEGTGDGLVGTVFDLRFGDVGRLGLRGGVGANNGGGDGARTQDGDGGGFVDGDGLVVDNQRGGFGAVGDKVSDDDVGGDGNVSDRHYSDNKTRS